MLDDRSVTNRIADLQQEASLSWQDPTHLRLLGRTVVNELRYQGEQKGWDAGWTDMAARTGLSDLYAGRPARSRPRSARIPSARLYSAAIDWVAGLL